MNTPTRILLSAIISSLIVAALNTYMNQYFSLTGGLFAYAAVGSLITILNIVVWPILKLLTLPLRLFFTLIAVILANAGFLWILLYVTNLMDPTLVTMQIKDGIMGWLVLSCIFGFAHWAMKQVLNSEGGM